MGLKLNGKMKKRIRKAVAGVCLVSAVLVAAIPADYSGVAQAEDMMELMDYNYDSNLPRNGKLTNNDAAAPSMIRPEDESLMHKSYCIRNIESEYVLVYEYDYFTQTTSKGTVGIIAAYNNFGATSQVNLSSTITTGFKIVKTEDYNTFVLDKIVNNPELDFVLRGTLNDTNASLAKNYFPNKYEEFENNYNDAVARYIAQEQEKGNIVTDSEARQKTLLELGGTEVKVTGSDMPEEYRRRYYCDHDGYYPTGVFTLQEVKNTAQGEEYYLNDTPTSDFIPDSGSLYVYKLVNNGPSTYKTDEEGFLITATQFVTAIGEKAFYNTKGVDDIIVGDGINYIGDSAFENSFIKTVSFNSVFYIGNSVFKNNANLSSITLTGATTVIGKEAFYGCPKLTEIVFNNELKEIGFGAFANCQNLSLIDFSTCTEGVNIGEYAFFDCPSARNVIFAPPQSKTSIGKAAFALSTNGPTSSMTVFDFPEIITEYTSAADNTTYRDILRDKDNATYNSPMGDYILAGRTNLITVTMPDQYVMNSQDIEVPINTFVGCENLETVIFPQNARMISYHKELFQDVENDKFYVRGPENKSQNSPNPAMPRTSTWSASTNAAKYVPYVYTDRFGIEHYEVGNGIYRYELQINTTEDGEEDGTATLISCQFIDAAQTIDEMIVPGIVASYRVTALGDGCYSTDSLTSPAVKDYIVNLVVADDSIEEIGQSVFSNCAKLESVQLGNSVKTIGTNAFSDNKLLEEVTIGGGIESVGEKAFANCPKLTDVIWEKPISNNTQVVIADDSFATGGEMLYFEGDIALGYGPFDYAMEDETVGKSHYINNINGTRICYRSSGPNYYYVIRDEAAGENLLIDYPHYADLPLDVRERYERRTEVVSENGMVVTLDAPLKPSALDLQLVEQTRRLVLPEAVTSIDVKSFCLSDGANNVNQGSWIYITALDEQNVSGGINISRQDLYSNDDLAVGGIPLKDTFEESGGYHSGLFSGYYVDQIPLSSTDGIDTTRFPLQTKGNDWITSIEMPGVTSIPEYAFESCESLQSIIISEACKEIAPTSFRNCNALRTVTATGDYTFDNYILYKTLADGTYQIMTCLPGRGLINQDITDRFVNVDNDPKLADTSELEVGAFYGCAGIVGVDLSDTSIIKVPQNTFNNCTMLSEVTLPDTPDMIIEGDVFRGNGSTIKVTIPAVLSIADSAFDPVHTITNIYTKPECRFITTTYQKKDANGNTINSKTNIYVHFMDSEFTVSFLNDDNTPYEERTVKSGSATYLPDVNPTPKKEEHSGWIFDSWKYYYTDWTEYDQPGNPLQSVTTDLYAVAQFVPDPEMPYYTITFRYDDYSVFETKQVAEGNNGLLPSTNPQPKLPEHQGWNFSHWNYYDSTLGLENVTEDRNAIAVFTPASVSGNEPGNNPSGGDRPGNNPNGSSNNNPSSGNNSSTSNNSASNNSASNNAANNNGKYNVIVENGGGGGYYTPGSVVTITAYAAPTGKVFDRWTTSNTDIGFSNAFGSSTTFIMPTHEVKVTATYKTPSASSNRVSQNSTTNGTTNNNNNNNNNTSGSGSSTTNRNPSKGGTDVTVTTSTIDNNNKNLASATVAGSTDNFVVKITDSAVASAAAEQALRAQYGDLSNIRFVGFDISLYDETGTRKIENTAGLAVTITIPIPDELVPYAGNNMAAGVVNGVLDPMAVKFTTIDGVPCMQFTATHFSPYVIYVNTNNLVSGVTDTTPKTGDIHPKWFLAIGLACISGVLFTWKDKRKVPV